ncbi:Gfo/Idh/MocA family protein [Deinococcus sp.]|uniref:Gfo/Idh/MocA family protein n=1 Tax=Deinococcus sp. TaxID=47478 RepID=UPI003CC6A9B5
MTYAEIGTAVIGTGFIGPVHVEALRRLGVSVRGILGSTPQKSHEAAQALGLERGYASLEELLADPGVQVVHVASPNRLHHAQASAALEAGKHVVCEKPLAMTSAEAHELLALSQSRPQQVAAVNYNVRFYPLNLQARQMVAAGEIGEVTAIRGAYLQDWLLQDTDFNWRVLAQEGGELRAIGDIGTHWLDLTAFISGLEVESLVADLQIVHPQRLRPQAGSTQSFGQGSGQGERVTVDTEDAGAVLLRYKGGARGSLAVSQVTAGRKNTLSWEIAGTRGTLAWNGERPDELWIGRRGQPNALLWRDPALLSGELAGYSFVPVGHPEGFADTFKGMYRAVYGDILNGARSSEPLYASFADGLRELRLCEAILTSHRERRWVTL